MAAGAFGVRFAQGLAPWPPRVVSRQVYELLRVLGTAKLSEPAWCVIDTVLTQAFRRGVVLPDAVSVEVLDEALAASIWPQNLRGRSSPPPKNWQAEVEAILCSLARTPLRWSIDGDTPWQSTLVHRWNREGGAYTVEVSRLLLRLAARLKPQAA
jgi:hypothetical protein